MTLFFSFFLAQEQPGVAAPNETNQDEGHQGKFKTYIHCDVKFVFSGTLGLL